MIYEEMVSLCDLLELYDQCDSKIERVALARLDNPTIEATVAYHRAIKDNIVLGEALLTKMAQEFETARMPGISDFPFEQVSIEIQDAISQSYVDIKKLEKQHHYLPRPQKIIG